MTVPSYSSWASVPWYLMTQTQIGELDLPRDVSGQPVAAWVRGYDYRGKSDEVALYDARLCPPTRATGAALAAAAARSTKSRRCSDCGAHLQRNPITPLGEGEDRSLRLCPACLLIMRMRATQTELAGERETARRWVTEVLSWDGLAVLWCDDVQPPPTPAGSVRKVTAVRLRACDSDGARLLDVTVRLVGPRAKFVPEGAVDRDGARPVIHGALVGRPLLAVDAEVYRRLREVAWHETWGGMPPAGSWVDGQWVVVPQEERDRLASIQALRAGVDDRITRWRGQLDPATGNLVPALPAGSPDRLLYLLRRMVGSREFAVSDDAVPATATAGRS